MSTTQSRVVSADLSFQIEQPAAVIVQVRAAASAGVVSNERLDIALDGVPLPIRAVAAEYGGSLDEVLPAPGLLTISYYAEIEAALDPPAPRSPVGSAELERQIMLRPSRYCLSDQVVGLALSEFGGLVGARARTEAVEAWIHDRIDYVPGFGGVNDSAIHTVLTGIGVCRDFAQLGIMLLRALNVPARFAAVYAPGLNPMDFHAVFEAWHDGEWWAYDATRLVPRQTLVRVATGRDAADTSFATVISGIATLIEMNVTATSGGDLPADDHVASITLA